MIHAFRISLGLLFITLYSFSFAQSNTTTHISGQIKGFPNNEVKLVYNRVPVMNKPLELKGRTDNEGNFIFQFGLDLQATIDLTAGGRTVALFLNPGDSINAYLDATDSNSFFQLSGKGYEESLLYYLNYHRFDSKIIPGFYERISGLSPEEYQKTVKSWMKDFESVLKQNLKDINAGKPLKQLAEQMIAIKEANYYLFYLNYKKSTSPENFTVPATYASVINNPALFKIDYPRNTEYQNFIFLHLTTLGPAPNDDACAGVITFLNYIDSVYAPNSRDELMMRVLWEGIESGCYRKIKKWYDAFVAGSPSFHYVQALQEKTAQMNTLQPGDPAPDFEFVDKDGNTHKLADLRGKVIYLDFWATWCGPCIRAMQQSGPLKEKFKDNKDVVFVYISTDQDVNKWKGHNITNGGDKYMWHVGQNAYATSNAYRIQTIPRYVIIDKDGNIVDPNAPRPYSQEIEAILLREAAKPYSGGSK